MLICKTVRQVAGLIDTSDMFSMEWVETTNMKNVGNEYVSAFLECNVLQGVIMFALSEVEHLEKKHVFFANTYRIHVRYIYLHERCKMAKWNTGGNGLVVNIPVPWSLWVPYHNNVGKLI